MANRKDSRLTGLNPLAYMGVEPTAPSLFFSAQREPTTNDYAGYNIGTIWLDRSGGVNGKLWTLVKKDDAIATWIQIGSGDGIETITPDAGILVLPDGVGNVNVLGGTNLQTVGTANTLTINIALDTIADTYQTDAGNAQPALGILKVLGGTNMGTTGAGNIVTINVVPDTIADTYVADVGSATPVAGTINVLGGAGVTTTGLGNTVTISADAAIERIITDAGTAIPVAGVINLLGGRNIGTSAVGNTITVDTDDPGEGVVQSSAAGIFSASKGDDGELLIGATGGTPAWNTLTAGPGVTIVNGPNSIQISASGIAPTATSNFKAYLNASVFNVTGDGTVYSIPFDQEFFDVAGEFDTTTGKFTAAAKGVYCFIANILCEDTDLGHDTAQTKVQITGTYNQTNAQNNFDPTPIVDNIDQYTFVISTTTRLDAGDTAELTLEISGGSKNVDIIATGGVGDIRTWFGGFLLATLP